MPLLEPGLRVATLINGFKAITFMQPMMMMSENNKEITNTVKMNSNEKRHNDDIEQEKLKIETSSGVASVQLLLRPGFDLWSQE